MLNRYFSFVRTCNVPFRVILISTRKKWKRFNLKIPENALRPTIGQINLLLNLIDRPCWSGDYIDQAEHKHSHFLSDGRFFSFPESIMQDIR